MAARPAAAQTAFAAQCPTAIDVDGTAGSLGWHFSVADSNVDFLATGETLKAVYDVSVTDNHFASSTQEVTVVFTGTNDVPVVDAGSSVLANAISELPNVTNSSAVDSTAGAVAFSDPDLDGSPHRHGQCRGRDGDVAGCDP